MDWRESASIFVGIEAEGRLTGLPTVFINTTEFEALSLPDDFPHYYIRNAGGEYSGLIDTLLNRGKLVTLRVRIKPGEGLPARFRAIPEALREKCHVVYHVEAPWIESLRPGDEVSLGDSERMRVVLFPFSTSTISVPDIYGGDTPL